MNNRPVDKEPLSNMLRRHPQGTRMEIADTVRWVGLSSLGIFLALITIYLLTGNYLNALVVSIGILPIIISLFILKQDTLSVPSAIIAVTIIFLITSLASLGQGIYDIGVLGFPVILIIAGLILRGRVIMYLVLLIIFCLAWLVFGDLQNWYTPSYAARAYPEDFFIGGVIILIAGNAIYRLVRNVYQNLTRAEAEIRMREEVEREREEVIRQLRHKNRELDRFAIRVSHDLKTPLITLAGFLGYLEKDINDGDYERAKKDFSQINDSAKTMGKFVDELLDLSRVGRITNPPTDVSFQEIVLDALKVTDGLLKARRVNVVTGPDLPVVHVDHARIVQVVQNMITNAVKFMGDQPDPRIRIGAEKIDDGHIFFIEDNGIGIAEEDHERIFELFNKLDPEREGTGLGLGLVKKIIEVHQGRVWVESEPGRGATFKFTLGHPNQENG